MDTKELLARRLIAQALAPTDARPAPTTLAEAARYMVATQGQNYAGGLTGLAIRAGQDAAPTGKNTSELDAAMADYEVIRTWSQRGTLHFLHRDDLWVALLCGHRSVAGNIDRLATASGITTDEYHSIQQATFDACPQLTDRASLRSVTAHLPQSSAVTSHHLRRLGASGQIIQGPKAGQHDTFIQTKVALPQELEQAQQRNKADATTELAQRYFSTRGPATIEDFCWWSSLPKGTSLKAIEQLAADGKLLRTDIGNQPHYMAPWQADVTGKELTAARRLTFHLPPFDEYFIAYKNRDALFAPGVDPLTVMTKNGISWPFTVAGGAITGRA